MVSFQTKNPNLDKFWRVLDCKMLIYLWPFVMFYRHLGYFMTIWYILCSFGTYFLVLVSCTKTNLATLVGMRRKRFIGNKLNQVEMSPIAALRNEMAEARVARFFFLGTAYQNGGKYTK
jgi:hypothetical protein